MHIIKIQNKYEKPASITGKLVLQYSSPSLILFVSGKLNLHVLVQKPFEEITPSSKKKDWVSYDDSLTNECCTALP